DAERKYIEEEITEKQKVLKIKFDNMIHKEILNDAVKGRLRLLYLEIKRLLEILEKIDPLLVNHWLQYFICDSFYIIRFRIMQLQHFIYNKLIPNIIKQKSSLVYDIQKEAERRLRKQK
ncbi:23059_t:CDS:1, partial [Racocetra persica]